MHLTDGTHFIKGFEYKQIPALSESILPGTKIELHGNINYRNGALFLGPENVKLLQGNIEGVTTKENLVDAIRTDL